MSVRILSICLLVVSILITGCEKSPTQTSTTSGPPSPTASVAASPLSPRPTEAEANAQALTFPILDAFLADSSFTDTLKNRTQLTDEQIGKLKELAHAETAKLSETNAGQTEGETAKARENAREKVSSLIGGDKTDQLSAVVRELWTGTPAKSATPAPPVAVTTNPTTPEQFAAMVPNTVPTDSRIVVNTPAFRMDVFENGQLIKSYKVGIGYPQFPLPTALRKAQTIIFNPTWTPPDEPWVSKMKNVAVGQKVEAGSPLNPLGPIKIPIGAPSLIHGGKPLAKIGTFASHGCVGLTSPQVRDFSKYLAQIAGNQLTDAAIAKYARDNTQTKSLKLNREVLVELRYETIVVEDGKLHIYRDVYDQDTNTEEELRAVLQAYGIKLEDLPPAEQDQIYDALAQMAGKSSKKIVRSPSTQPSPSPSASPEASPTGKKVVAKKVQVQKKKYGKEAVIDIAALANKGYPAPVDLDSGTGRPAKKQVAVKQ
jgi:lipoprotein-anchoring transpeptidase ErfK/SrfK